MGQFHYPSLSLVALLFYHRTRQTRHSRICTVDPDYHSPDSDDLKLDGAKDGNNGA